MDYGTVMCSASNTAGAQLEPCVFHIIAAGKYANLIVCAECRIRLSMHTRSDFSHGLARCALSSASLGSRVCTTSGRVVGGWVGGCWTRGCCETRTHWLQVGERAAREPVCTADGRVIRFLIRIPQHTRTPHPLPLRPGRPACVPCWCARCRAPVICMLTVLIAGDELAASGGNFCQQHAFIAAAPTSSMIQPLSSAVERCGLGDVTNWLENANDVLNRRFPIGFLFKINPTMLF